MEVLLFTVMGICNIICFVIGATVGQSVSRGEKVKIDIIKDPAAVVREIKTAHRERSAEKEAEREQERLEAIIRNVERYDGSACGQEDIT